jgi:peptide/nickel transport system substrate-binding protein
MWDTLLGQKIPDTGDPAYAKQLIAQSGEAAPTLVSNFGNTPVGQKTAAIVISSLAKAGIAVKLAPLETAKGGDFGPVGWGADWPNASDVIPPLFTVKGGFDLSRVDDPAFNAKVDAALNQLDRTKQATMWQALNKEAMQNVWVIPTFFGLSQTIAGTKIGGIYRWAAYGSWPYGAMYVKP